MLGKKRVDFLVIGAQKCGTSSLYQYLTQNLMIAPAIRKELHFFDLFYQRGIKWFHNHFNFKPGSITGESTPFYMLHPETPQRVRKYNPEMKLIAILRDPVERAVSHYRMSVAHQKENLSFEEALNAEDERLKEPLSEGNTDSAWLWNSYKKRGQYAQQLDHWANFFPISQIMLINYHEFFKNPWHNVQGIYRFLGVAPYFGSSKDFFENPSKQKIEIDDEGVALLKDYFEEPNRRLKEKYHISFE